MPFSLLPPPPLAFSSAFLTFTMQLVSCTCVCLTALCVPIAAIKQVPRSKSEQTENNTHTLGRTEEVGGQNGEEIANGSGEWNVEKD